MGGCLAQSMNGLGRQRRRRRVRLQVKAELWYRSHSRTRQTSAERVQTRGLQVRVRLGAQKRVRKRVRLTESRGRDVGLRTLYLLPRCELLQGEDVHGMGMGWQKQRLQADGQSMGRGDRLGSTCRCSRAWSTTTAMLLLMLLAAAAVRGA